MISAVIKCGSVGRLMQAIEKQTGGTVQAVGMTEPHSSHVFAGIPIETHPHLPENIAVMVQNGKITHIFNLDRIDDQTNL